MKKVISRYFNAQDLKRIKDDFAPVLEQLKNLRHQLSFCIRENYFKLAFRGNSLIVVVPKTKGYQIEIPENFVSKRVKANFPGKKIKGDSGTAYTWKVSRKEIEEFFNRKNLESLISKVKKLPFNEEDSFEQLIVCDNFTNLDEIIIDRRISDTGSTHNADLVSLKKKEDGEYSLNLHQLKMGWDPEIASSVAEGLEGFVKHVQTHFEDYKETYEQQYIQKKELGLIPHCFPKKITIAKDIRGEVVILGYALEAEPSVAKLKTGFPKLNIRKIYFNL